MSRQQKLKDLKLKQELDRIKIFLSAKSRKGTVVCFNCWRDWRAVMSINEEKKLSFGKMLCPHCSERRGLFVEDKWETKSA